MIFPRHSTGTECAWDDSFRISISEQVKCEIKNAEKKSGIKATKEQVENAQWFLDKNDGSVRGICNKDTIFKGALILNTGNAGGYVIVAKDGCVFKGMDEYVAATSGVFTIEDKAEAPSAESDPTRRFNEEQFKYEVKTAEGKAKNAVKFTEKQKDAARPYLAEHGGKIRGIVSNNGPMHGAVCIFPGDSGDVAWISPDGKLYIGKEAYLASLDNDIAPSIQEASSAAARIEEAKSFQQVEKKEEEAKTEKPKTEKVE